MCDYLPQRGFSFRRAAQAFPPDRLAIASASWPCDMATWNQQPFDYKSFWEPQKAILLVAIFFENCVSNLIFNGLPEAQLCIRYVLTY